MPAVVWLLISWIIYGVIFGNLGTVGGILRCFLSGLFVVDLVLEATKGSKTAHRLGYFRLTQHFNQVLLRFSWF
jgi:hypothetical protein